MRKYFIAACLSLLTISSYADLNGNGYYRVMNYGSSRWANLVDNYASVDFFAGTADLHSLELTNNEEAIISDPGSIVYITAKGGNQYDVAAQGITLESLVDNNISIRANGTSTDGQTLYMLYGTYKGVTKYIGDSNLRISQELGNASLNATDPDFNKWYIIPVNVSSDNYFGIKPTVETNQGYYTSMFTSFAYEPYSTGVKAYYIDRVGYGMAEMVEITGAVPPGSPVVIECAGPSVSQNRMQIKEMQDALPANSLTGVYFDYSGPSHTNHVKYDKDTMRVLGTCSDGSLGFIVADLEYIPGNTAYLTVPAGSLPEIKCVSSTYYVENLPEAPESFYLSEDYALYPQGEDNYSGSFEIPAVENGGDLKIRFYASSYNVAEKYIGPYTNEGDVNLSEGEQIKPFIYDSPGYWVIPSWRGGKLDVTINLQYQYVVFDYAMAGVDIIESDEKGLKLNGDLLVSDSGKGIKVYSLSGMLIKETSNSELSLSDLPKGSYLAVSNGSSLKIIR